MPQVRVNDIDIYYAIHGEGYPLVLIEGMSYATWMWFKQVGPFSEHFKVILFDNRGTGKTDKPDMAYTIPLFAQDTLGLMDAIGIERAHILGYSMGGLIAQQMAISYPERIHGLVLCATFLAGPHAVPMSEELLRELQDIQGLSPEQMIRKNMALAYTEAYLMDHQDEFNQMVAWRLENPQPPYAYLRQLSAAVGLDIEDRLNQISHPTLIIHGGADLVVPTENARLIAERIPHARMIIYEGVAHHCFTARAEDFNRNVIEFLKGL